MRCGAHQGRAQHKRQLPNSVDYEDSLIILVCNVDQSGRAIGRPKHLPRRYDAQHKYANRR